MTILVKKVFISSKPTFVYLLCPPLCGPFSIQESAAGGLSYKARNSFRNLFLYQNIAHGTREVNTVVCIFTKYIYFLIDIVYNIVNMYRSFYFRYLFF